MSDNEVNDKGLHILLGICGSDENMIRTLKEEFSNRGLSISFCISKYQKQSVEEYVSENKNLDVLIVSEYLQQSKPYEIKDFERLSDINSKLMIVPVLSDEKKGTPYISELSSLGIYTALFESDATISKIVDLITNGRTRKEARYYYGVESIKDIGDTTNEASCIDYIAYGGNPENTKDRADHVRQRISSKEFEAVMAKLPKDIRSRLQAFDDYEQYFIEAPDSLSDKKGFSPVRLIRNFLPEATEEKTIPLVVKQEIQSAVKKVVIGFAGTQPRIGTTHQTILFGNFLNAAGYKVAVIENELCDNKCFSTLGSRYEIKDHEEYFELQNVDFYPNFNLNDLRRIFLKDYNFVLIDFGEYKETMALEFGRCVVQIIITGSKPWETSMLERFMMMVNDEDVLKKFNYLFMNTPDEDKKFMIKNMDTLKKVYFSEYQADPFVSNGYSAIKEILEDYLPEVEIRKGRLIDKVKKLFE